MPPSPDNFLGEVVKLAPHSLTGLTRPLAVLDSEWTSGAPESARLVQLCIRRLEPGGATMQRHWLINPEVPIEPGAQAVHGISDAEVANAPVFDKIAAEVAVQLAGADIAGHGIAGDIAILERQLSECRLGWHVERLAIVDTLRVWQARETRTLADAYRHFAVCDSDDLPDDQKAHDARGDVAMATAVIEAQASSGLHVSASARELHDEGARGQVDPAGKFRRRDDGVIVYGFGQYRMLPVAEHLEYLNWMLGKDFQPSTKRIAHKLIDTGGQL